VQNCRMGVPIMLGLSVLQATSPVQSRPSFSMPAPMMHLHSVQHYRDSLLCRTRSVSAVSRAKLRENTFGDSRKLASVVTSLRALRGSAAVTDCTSLLE